MQFSTLGPDLLAILIEISEILLMGCDKLLRQASPFKFQAGGVQGVVREDKADPLLFGQAVFDERQV